MKPWFRTFLFSKFYEISNVPMKGFYKVKKISKVQRICNVHEGERIVTEILIPHILFPTNATQRNSSNKSASVYFL